MNRWFFQEDFLLLQWVFYWVTLNPTSPTNPCLKLILLKSIPVHKPSFSTPPQSQRFPVLLLSLITAKINNQKAPGSRPSHCFWEETKPDLGTTQAAAEETYTSKPVGNYIQEHLTSQLLLTADYYFPLRKSFSLACFSLMASHGAIPHRFLAFTVSGCNKRWHWFPHPCRLCSL